MENLENYGVREMDTRELGKTQGGFFVIAAIALTIVILNTDWDQAAADFKEGFKSA